MSFKEECIKEISIYEVCPKCGSEGIKVGNVDYTIYTNITIFTQCFKCPKCKIVFDHKWDSQGGEWRT